MLQVVHRCRCRAGYAAAKANAKSGAGGFVFVPLTGNVVLTVKGNGIALDMNAFRPDNIRRGEVNVCTGLDGSNTHLIFYTN